MILADLCAWDCQEYETMERRSELARVDMSDIDQRQTSEREETNSDNCMCNCNAA